MTALLVKSRSLLFGHLPGASPTDPANVEEQPLSGQVELFAPAKTELFPLGYGCARYMTEEYEEYT